LHSLKRWRIRDLLSAAALLLLVTITSCQSTAEPATITPQRISQQLPTATSLPTATATLLSPVVDTVLAPTAEPVDLPAFSLVDVPPTLAPTILPTDTPKGEGAIDAKAAPTGTRLPTNTPFPTDTPSPTPPPTFTPPALPFTSPNEHYWLRRPIAEGGTVWTDKSYSYGGTRGGTLRPHHGVEFYVPTGTEILAAASGTVLVAGQDDEVIYGPHDNFYGNVAVIELDSTFLGQPVYNLYGHLSEILVSEGQHVDAQDIIALSGASGVADGPHLHFEVRVGQNSYSNTRNPLLWLYPFPEHGTVAGRVAWPSGELLHGAQLFLRRIDAGSKYAETSSYANRSEVLNGDEGWAENFAFDDVVAGYYEIEVRRGSRKIKEELWVYPYRTSFVDITLDW
jgi:murein DD-endopeptidase MepM/ murein hydrolase activator NlpD